MTTAIAQDVEALPLDVEFRTDLVAVDDRLVRMIRDDRAMQVVLRELVDGQDLPEPDELVTLGENLGVVVGVYSPDPTLIPTTKHADWIAEGNHKVGLERAAAYYVRAQS